MHTTHWMGHIGCSGQSCFVTPHGPNRCMAGWAITLPFSIKGSVVAEMSHWGEMPSA